MAMMDVGVPDGLEPHVGDIALHRLPSGSEVLAVGRCDIEVDLHGQRLLAWLSCRLLIGGDRFECAVRISRPYDKDESPLRGLVSSLWHLWQLDAVDDKKDQSFWR